MAKSAKVKKAKKFPLEIRSIRVTLKTRIGAAERSVKAGEAAVARATKAGDKDRARRNRASLADAKNALRNLNSALKFARAACCNERENCDPIFE